MIFIESTVCKSRSNCVACRRDKKFREHFEKENGGPWVCPLNIDIDAPDSAFKPELIEKWKLATERQQKQQQLILEAKIALEEMLLVATGQDLVRLEKIQSAFFPATKEATKCLNSGKSIGEVDQVCCGGTIKKVQAYECRRHVICTDKKCQSCSDYHTKKS